MTTSTNNNPDDISASDLIELVHWFTTARDRSVAKRKEILDRVSDLAEAARLIAAEESLTILAPWQIPLVLEAASTDYTSGDALILEGPGYGELVAVIYPGQNGT
jgi:hypothetical protein